MVSKKSDFQGFDVVMCAHNKVMLLPEHTQYTGRLTSSSLHYLI